MIEEGEYFTEAEIRRREPLLYHLYIGRYIRTGQDDSINLSDIIMQQIDRKEHEAIVATFLELYPEHSEDLDLVEKPLTAQEQEDLEDELIVLMHHRFLAGFDTKFVNYSEIDQNE